MKPSDSKLSIGTGDEAQATLSSAILIYEVHDRPVFASAHAVATDAKGAPVIRSGKAITVQALQELARNLATTHGVTLFNWTSENTVLTGPGVHVWWTPACKRWMHFEASNLSMHMPAMQPPLLWAIAERALYVFGLRLNQRPQKDTVLCHAPYMNVFRNGAVCLGNMPVPQEPSPVAWEDAFYAANFTHPNDAASRQLTTYKGGLTKLWRDLMSPKRQRDFPLNTLVDAGITLEDFIEKLGATNP